jgi:hypothetical protein
MVTTTTCRVLLLVAVVLTAHLFWCTAYADVDGFSVELIHRDSVKSPYHDPALTVHDRVRAAVRRSAARAAALGRSYVGGAVSEIVSRPFEYLMHVNVGTPPIQILAVADTGSDLTWFKCKPLRAAAGAAAPSGVYDPSSSSTFTRVGCRTSACYAVSQPSCDASSNCQYLQAYGDGSSTSGVLCTETFTFDTVPGGCLWCWDSPKMQAPKVNFGCSTSINGTFFVEALVGLGAGSSSLIAQLATVTPLSRRFSYCLAPYTMKTASSALNFGDRAAVKEPGAATTMLVHSDHQAYYTIELEAFRIGNFTFGHLSRVVIDSGTSLTFLEKEFVDLIVKEMTLRIGLPTVQSPEKFVHLCYDVSGLVNWYIFHRNVPDMTVRLNLGATVTLRLENMFVAVRDGLKCLAISPVTEERPLAILGNIAQQNMHVGYDLDKWTVTFAPADCARSYNSPPVYG